MKKVESHRHFIWGDNKQWYPEYEFIVHMDEPRCFIKYPLREGYFADFENFYKGIADVQWIDGRPNDPEVIEKVLIDAYNFLAIEERLLEQDLEDFEAEEDIWGEEY